jgi:hypothetical protein
MIHRCGNRELRATRMLLALMSDDRDMYEVVIREIRPCARCCLRCLSCHFWPARSCFADFFHMSLVTVQQC